LITGSIDARVYKRAASSRRKGKPVISDQTLDSGLRRNDE